MSLISKRQKMPSENPEMTARLLIKSVFLEVKALLQIQMQLPFTIQRFERVWDWGIGIG